MCPKLNQSGKNSTGYLNNWHNLACAFRSITDFNLYRLDEWFSIHEATGQLGLNPQQIVATVCLATFLQDVVAVG